MVVITALLVNLQRQLILVVNESLGKHWYVFCVYVCTQVQQYVTLVHVLGDLQNVSLR